MTDFSGSGSRRRFADKLRRSLVQQTLDGPALVDILTYIAANASGTWGIDISGNAATADFATTAGSAPNELTADELAAVNGAAAPSAANVFATMADLPAGGSGDVVGPASATDNALVRFDGTTGKLVQDSNATLSDAGDFVIGSGSILVQGTAGTQLLVRYNGAGGNDFGLYVGSGGDAIMGPIGAYYDRNLTLRYRVAIADQSGSASISDAVALGLPASDADFVPLQFGLGTDPSSPVNGMLWFKSDGPYYRAGGVTVGPLAAGGSGVDYYTARSIALRRVA